MAANKPALPESLRSPDAYPHETASIELIETHISWVLLTGNRAYKLKKPVELPFLDFSSLERREHFCHEELKLNRRLSPELYLDVVPIGGTPEQPQVGARPAIEYAVQMRQFPRDATADRLIESGELSAAEVADLGQRIARFHQSLEPESADSQIDMIAGNLDELLELAGDGDETVPERLAGRLRKLIGQLGPLFDERRDAGFVRECHGDLHLGNVARIGDRLVPFDCLEFDRSLRTIDVIDEIAFGFMDLTGHGRSDLAFAYLNGWLEVTGDFAGLRLLRLYAAHRALVRLKVALIGARASGDSGGGDRAERYRHAAGAVLPDSDARLLLTRGLSGSGKTTIARGLAQALGAVHLRSDIERKRIGGVDPRSRAGDAVGRGLYDPAVTASTYDALLNGAAAALDGGLNVIVDASFLARERRAPFIALAERLGQPCLILDCIAGEATLRQRIAQRARRNDDPSDADDKVLDSQLESAEPLTDEERALALTIDTEKEVDYAALADRIRNDLARD